MDIYKKEIPMADESGIAGKSKEEIAYMLMHDLMNAADGPGRSRVTRIDILSNFIAARHAVYGVPTQALETLKN